MVISRLIIKMKAQEIIKLAINKVNLQLKIKKRLNLKKISVFGPVVI